MILPDGQGEAELRQLTEQTLARCDTAGQYSEEVGKITRTFLCEPMRRLHQQLAEWMSEAGMQVRVDAIGNVIGHYPGERTEAPLFLIGSHIDTVPDAGKYDGVLGVLLGIAAVKSLRGRPLPFALEVIAFSEEEGIRYRTPYLGSSAVAGVFDPSWLERIDAQAVSLADAARNFGLDPALIPQAAYQRERVLGYLEVHIEQGPVLDALNLPLAVVEGIIGQSRLWVSFHGKAGHAGTLPMELRHDALTPAAEFVLAVERHARSVEGLRATVGMISVTPGVVNVVPGAAKLTLDLRHAQDSIRMKALAALLHQAEHIAEQRGVAFAVDYGENHPAVPTDTRLTGLLSQAVRAAGQTPHRMVSGAGHDAAVLASRMPAAMLFIRSPGGISHHPEERVQPLDVRLALEVVIRFLESGVT
jgi:allantoate deiminase